MGRQWFGSYTLLGLFWVRSLFRFTLADLSFHLISLTFIRLYCSSNSQSYSPVNPVMRPRCRRGTTTSINHRLATVPRIQMTLVDLPCTEKNYGWRRLSWILTRAPTRVVADRPRRVAVAIAFWFKTRIVCIRSGVLWPWRRYVPFRSVSYQRDQLRLVFLITVWNVHLIF